MCAASGDRLGASSRSFELIAIHADDLEGVGPLLPDVADSQRESPPRFRSVLADERSRDAAAPRSCGRCSPPASVRLVEVSTAKDYAELGVSSIEHFYGVADAALTGIQNFPAGDELLERDPIASAARASCTRRPIPRSFTRSSI